MSSTAVASNQQTAQILGQQNFLSREVLDALVSRANTLQEWIGQVAVDDQILTDIELSKFLSQSLHIPLINLATFSPDHKALEYLPADSCRTNLVVPVRLDNGTLHIASANPLDRSIHTTLPAITHCNISVQIAPISSILEAVEEWYGGAQLPSQAPPDPTGLKIPAFLTPGNGQTISPDLLSPSPTGYPLDITLDQLLIYMSEHRASDLHLTVGAPPLMRVDGELSTMPFPPLKPIDTQEIIYTILSDVQITHFEQHQELDFAYSLPGLARFRVNVYKQRGSISSVLRAIPTEIPSLDKLKMPQIIRELTNRPRGLVLVTGPTGSGKSTTLAAMVDEINSNQRMHIITIEDPIEFLHKHKKSEVNQREVGSDTGSFSTALRHVLRQDPDVILIGEMRDLETISAALTAAETGHLVFATLHTTSAAQTIDRVIDVFPPYQQEQIRSQLANVLEGIITQTLLPVIDGRGRACAQEILIATPAIRNLIREAKVHQMASVMQASAKYGMQTLDQALRDLVLQRRVTAEAAIVKASNPEDFKALLSME